MSSEILIRAHSLTKNYTGFVAVKLSRGLMIGNLESSLLLSIIWIAAVTLVFFVLSINLMKRKLIK